MSDDVRQQTTKGLWASGTDTGPTLIIDVEGTDGSERADQKDFERKSALFTLVTSEVLIVNMLEHTVSLHESANATLLKTVFEANLELFHASTASSSDTPADITKTLLLFVIRDFPSSRPNAEARWSSTKEKVVSNMHAYWHDISEQVKRTDTLAFDQLFDVKFYALPSFTYEEARFERDLAAFRPWYTLSRPQGVLMPAQVHRSESPRLRVSEEVQA